MGRLLATLWQKIRTTKTTEDGYVEMRYVEMRLIWDVFGDQNDQCSTLQGLHLKDDGYALDDSSSGPTQLLLSTQMPLIPSRSGCEQTSARTQKFSNHSATDRTSTRKNRIRKLHPTIHRSQTQRTSVSQTQKLKSRDRCHLPLTT